MPLGLRVRIDWPHEFDRAPMDWQVSCFIPGSNPDPLDFAHADVIVAPVIEARGFRVSSSGRRKTRLPDAKARTPFGADYRGEQRQRRRDSRRLLRLRDRLGGSRDTRAPMDRHRYVSYRLPRDGATLEEDRPSRKRKSVARWQRIHHSRFA